MFKKFVKMLKKFFKKIKPCETYGEILVGTGNYEIFIHTYCQPLNIFLSLHEPPESHQICCESGVNMASARPTSHGFILYADIKSEICEIEWIAEY